MLLSYKEATVQVEGAVLILLVQMYPLRTGEKKTLKVLMINKNLLKYLARRNGNEILIWSCINPQVIIPVLIP